MRLLCASNSLAFVHSLRIALDGEDIRTYCTDADATLSSIAGPMTGIAARLYVLHEADWDRAVDVMRALDERANDTDDADDASAEGEAPATAPASTYPYWIWLVVGVVAAAAFAVVRNL
ncbi:MAG: putative signal transducing protein [Pseudomonadota bacterium]